MLADEVCSIINGKLIRESSINLFHGYFSVKSGCFDTGRIKILLPRDSNSCSMIAIEPAQIVLSRAELDSSMRNSFRGQIKDLHSQGNNVQVTIEAGEKFHAVITGAAQNELKLGFGDTVWLSFKSSAVKVIQ
jgi:molybdopterin-binding protein